MKRESNKQKLIAELLGDDSDLRAATLQRGLILSRRKRKRRHVWRASWLVLTLVAALWLQLHHEHRESAIQSAISKAPPQTASPNLIEGTSVRVLTDAELLDLFKDRPVALIGPSGRQRLLLFDEKPN